MKKCISFFISVILTALFLTSFLPHFNFNNSLYVKNPEESLSFFNEVYKSFDKEINLYESKELLDKLNYNYEIVDKTINDEIIIKIYMNQNKMSDNINLFFNKNNSNKNLLKITYSNLTDKKIKTTIIDNISTNKTYSILQDGNKIIRAKNITHQENFLFG